MRAIRRDAQPRRKRERTRVASVLLAPGIAEARGQASVTYVGGAGDDPYLDSYREQLAEERERGDGRHRTPGVDEHGRTRSDRAVWASVLRGFVLVLTLLGVGEARAVTLVEPTATEPCDRTGGVYGCVVVLRGQATWFRPSSLCGGGRHPLPDLALDGVRALDLPLDVSAACYGPGGWGPSWRGTLAVMPVAAP